MTEQLRVAVPFESRLNVDATTQAVVKISTDDGEYVVRVVLVSGGTAEPAIIGRAETAGAAIDDATEALVGTTGDSRELLTAFGRMLRDLVVLPAAPPRPRIIPFKPSDLRQSAHPDDDDWEPERCDFCEHNPDCSAGFSTEECEHCGLCFCMKSNHNPTNCSMRPRGW